MKWFKLTPKACLLLLAMAVGAQVATPVSAQVSPAPAASQASQPTPCGVQMAAGNQQPPNYGGYPYEYPEDGGGYNQTPPEPPKPQNPVRKLCEDGKVEIRLGNDRHFGYRIGDHIPVVVLVLVDPTVKIDFTSLTQQVLGFEGSDFELAAPARVRSQVQANGKVLYRIDLTVVTWVPKDGVVFNLDLRYATKMAVDGKTPDWKRLTTPDFVVSRSWTADNGESLLEGDLEGRPLGSSWIVLPGLVLAFFLILLAPGLGVVKWLFRVVPRKVLPPKAAAWRVLDPILKDAKENGFKFDHYKAIAATLRRYLGATKGVPIEPATFEEVKHRLEGDAELPMIESAFEKCERVIFESATLTDEDNVELVSQVEQLVPRPWEER